MEKIIELAPKTTKWIYLFNGLVNCFVGYLQFLRGDSLTNWATLLGIVLMIAGPIMITYSLILFNTRNKLTPKVQLDENGISIKEDIHKRLVRIDWSNIKEITYKSFELSFQLVDGKIETVSLPTNGETSIKIKKVIRQFADDRQVKIIGG